MFRFWCITSARRGWHGGKDVGHIVYHRTSMSSFMQWWFAAYTSTRFDGPDVSGFGRYTVVSVGERLPWIYFRCPVRHLPVTQMQWNMSRMSPQKIKKEEECVADMLAGGQIEPSDCPWSPPVVLMTKKDDGTWFCMDYRRLNIATVRDAYPLPRIDDTLDMLAGKQWFSTLASGYWQVSLSHEARIKTAFATHSGLFQFKIMPFGLCNAQATFERLMDRVLQGLRWSRCLVYLDYIISFGSTFIDALDNVTLIFERLRAYSLQLKSTKCHLFQTSVPFLGHIVSRRGLECDPNKIEEVKSWPVPDCLKSVRQFLGFVGYHRRFLPKFADLATPLVTLTGKDVPFVWGPVCAILSFKPR